VAAVFGPLQAAISLRRGLWMVGGGFVPHAALACALARRADATAGPPRLGASQRSAVLGRAPKPPHKPARRIVAVTLRETKPRSGGAESPMDHPHRCTLRGGIRPPLRHAERDGYIVFGLKGRDRTAQGEERSDAGLGRRSQHAFQP
jgi:hypothetical protein